MRCGRECTAEDPAYDRQGSCPVAPANRGQAAVRRPRTDLAWHPQQQATIVREAMAQLSDPQLAMIYRSHYLGRTTTQIAAELGTNGDLRRRPPEVMGAVDHGKLRIGQLGHRLPNNRGLLLRVPRQVGPWTSHRGLAPVRRCDGATPLPVVSGIFCGAFSPAAHRRFDDGTIRIHPRARSRLQLTDSCT